MRNLVGITHNQRQLCAANTADRRIVIHSMGHIKMALAHFPPQHLRQDHPLRLRVELTPVNQPSRRTIRHLRHQAMRRPQASRRVRRLRAASCQQTVQPAMINLLCPRLTIHARPDQDGMRNQGIIRVPSTGSPVITKPSSSHRGMEAGVPAIVVREYSSSQAHREQVSVSQCCPRCAHSTLSCGAASCRERRQ